MKDETTEISDVIKGISRKLEQPMGELLQALSTQRTSSLFEKFDTISCLLSLFSSASFSFFFLFRAAFELFFLYLFSGQRLRRTSGRKETSSVTL